nr:hypothetical protein Iba_chr14bCG11960 [Ipomoea batatas]
MSSPSTVACFDLPETKEGDAAKLLVRKKTRDPKVVDSPAANRRETRKMEGRTETKTTDASAAAAIATAVPRCRRSAATPTTVAAALLVTTHLAETDFGLKRRNLSMDLEKKGRSARQRIIIDHSHDRGREADSTTKLPMIVAGDGNAFWALGSAWDDTS